MTRFVPIPLLRNFAPLHVSNLFPPLENDGYRQCAGQDLFFIFGVLINSSNNDRQSMAGDVTGDGGHSVSRGARHTTHRNRHHPHQEDPEKDARPEK
ncbi:hypothetical protein CDAR_400151 [Caerostris darwini]|uniref:Uncharacterized protein n=1 Tax=Caerostris darwini TaxID=1538125 RepID=A0AAV4SFI2_9ARAC|nr:hypothetical protein CDAR_400151 [Caerostris darwini]